MPDSRYIGVVEKAGQFGGGKWEEGKEWMRWRGGEGEVYMRMFTLYVVAVVVWKFAAVFYAPRP